MNVRYHLTSSEDDEEALLAYGELIRDPGGHNRVLHFHRNETTGDCLAFTSWLSRDFLQRCLLSRHPSRVMHLASAHNDNGPIGTIDYIHNVN
jgi:hypothetical protein